MFKLLKRLICIVVIALIIFFGLALWEGGEKFRWFGRKSEKAGRIIKKESESVGEKADKIKEGVGKVEKGIKKLKGDSKTDEKPSD